MVLNINVLLHTKSEQKVIGNEICTPIILKNVKLRSFNNKYTFTIYVGRVWVEIVFFLLKKLPLVYKVHLMCKDIEDVSRLSCNKAR